MPKKTLCPFCGKESILSLIDFPQRAKIDGLEVSFVSPALQCSVCGHEMFTPEQVDASLDASKKAYEMKLKSFSSESNSMKDANP